MSEAGAVPEIEAARAELVAAFNRGDTGAVAAMFADEGTLLPPGTRMLTARQDVQAFWGSVAERVGEITMTATNVKPLGAEAAREVGRIRMRPSGEQGQEIVSKYLLLWQKTAGKWTIESMIWNRVRAQQQARPQQGGGPGARAQGRRGQAGYGRSPAGRGGYGRVGSLYSR